MKRFAILLLVFAISKVGVALAAPINGDSIQNFFLGNSFNKPATYNQVLALLIGPEGKPGPAGVAGRNGFNGINGLNGRDGIDGAPGPVGPQGLIGPQGPVGPQGPAGPQGEKGDTGPAGAPGAAGAPGPSGVAGQSVVITELPVGDSNCRNGGSKFQVGSSITFACNGSATGGSGSSSSFGGGILELTSCDDLVSFNLDTSFKNSFFLDSVTMSQVKGACNNLKLTMVFQIVSNQTLKGTKYSQSNQIYCEYPLTSGTSSSDNNTYVVPATAVCKVNKTGAGLQLSDIATADIDNLIGFQIV